MGAIGALTFILGVGARIEVLEEALRSAPAVFHHVVWRLRRGLAGGCGANEYREDNASFHSATSSGGRARAAIGFDELSGQRNSEAPFATCEGGFLNRAVVRNQTTPRSLIGADANHDQ